MLFFEGGDRSKTNNKLVSDEQNMNESMAT